MESNDKNRFSPNGEKLNDSETLTIEASFSEVRPILSFLLCGKFTTRSVRVK